MHSGETLSSPPEFLKEPVLEVSLGKSHGGEEDFVDGQENEHHLLENIMHGADWQEIRPYLCLFKNISYYYSFSVFRKSRKKFLEESSWLWRQQRTSLHPQGIYCGHLHGKWFAVKCGTY